ncbi:hypothetical protein [Actinoallomurus liliacearum]|uniref:hypothetical protein n=1 Tax=Actinoallomurus liliacearum TaxID=1080073 RepID=UPI0031F0FEE6
MPLPFEVRAAEGGEYANARVPVARRRQSSARNLFGTASRRLNETLGEAAQECGEERHVHD